MEVVTQHKLHKIQDSRRDCYGQEILKKRVKSNTQQNFSGKIDLKAKGDRRCEKMDDPALIYSYSTVRYSTNLKIRIALNSA